MLWNLELSPSLLLKFKWVMGHLFKNLLLKFKWVMGHLFKNLLTFVLIDKQVTFHAIIKLGKVKVTILILHGHIELIIRECERGYNYRLTDFIIFIKGVLFRLNLTEVYVEESKRQVSSWGLGVLLKHNAFRALIILPKQFLWNFWSNWFDNIIFPLI